MNKRTSKRTRKPTDYTCNGNEVLFEDRKKHTAPKNKKAQTSASRSKVSQATPAKVSQLSQATVSSSSEQEESLQATVSHSEPITEYELNSIDEYAKDHAKLDLPIGKDHLIHGVYMNDWLMLSLNSETAAMIFNLVNQGLMYKTPHYQPNKPMFFNKEIFENVIFRKIMVNQKECSYELFKFKCGLLDKKNSDCYSTDKSKNKSPYRFICERETWMFHGTAIETAEKIMRTGFDAQFCLNQYRFYGVGLYLSRWFDYSHGFARPDKYSNRCMILCRVKVGDVQFSNPYSDDDFLENGKQYDTRIAYAEAKSLWPKDPDNIVIPPRNFDCVLPYAVIYYSS
jgi:hypothetical protein